MACGFTLEPHGVLFQLCLYMYSGLQLCRLHDSKQTRLWRITRGLTLQNYKARFKKQVPAATAV